MASGLPMARCASRASTARAAFEFLNHLHHRPCDAHTPVVVHEWTHAGLGNALGQLILSLQFAALHNRTLVTVEFARGTNSPWVWTNSTGFTPHDVYWPSSCDEFAVKHGVRSFVGAIRMREPSACPSWGCSWANIVPESAVTAGVGSSECVFDWYAHLTHFILRPSLSLMDWVKEVGLMSCSRALCGAASSSDARNGGIEQGGVPPRRVSRASGWLSTQAQQHSDASHRERFTMQAAAIAHASHPAPHAQSAKATGAHPADKIEATGVDGWRPPFASGLATALQLLPATGQHAQVLSVHLRSADACEGVRPYEQRPACVYSSVP